ncbi:hypothetical protein BJX64DRAFT_300477 [Aspergillus heterothallicus]
MKPSLFWRALLTIYIAPALCQILNIVAHQDDDLLFLSPDLLQYIQAGYEVRTVFITAGDSGMETSYWQGRERGARAAYALMRDAPDAWTEQDAGLPGHQAPLFTLNEDPNVSLVFLRLPDGHLQGQGFDVTGNESLQKLWEGGIPNIHTVNGSGSYTKDELLNALVSLMTSFRPERVNTLDYVHQYGDGDHSDHHSAAFFVAEAVKKYEGEAALTGYMGYPTINETANIVGAGLLEKQLAFYAYARGDPAVCSSHMACQSDLYYPKWLERQYRLDDGPISNAVSVQFAGLNAAVVLNGAQSSDPRHMALSYEWAQVSGTPVDLVDAETSHPSFTTPSEPDTLVFELVVSNGEVSSAPAVVTITTMRYPDNIALKAQVTASSTNSAAGQTPEKAIDASTGGFPADHTHEWATDGGKTGSWLSLSWDNPQVVSRVVLYDRPNLDDQVNGSLIEFDDGEIIDMGELNDYGTANSFDMADKVVHGLTVRITGVSPSTMNVGLSEIQVFGIADVCSGTAYSCVTFTIFETSPAGLPSASSVGCWQNWSAWTVYRERPSPATSSESSSTTTTTTSKSVSGTSTGEPTPTEDPVEENNSNSGGSTDQGWIAGAVIGPVAGFAIVFIAAFVYLRRKKHQYMHPGQLPQDTAYYEPQKPYPAPSSSSSEPSGSHYGYAPVRPVSEIAGHQTYEMSSTGLTELR